MKLSVLKKIRVGIALVFFLLLALFFLDFRHLVPEKLISGTLYFQFAPSLMKFLVTASLATAGFLVILLLTVLFGRVYCSTICPLGILQDVITRIANRFRSKKKRRYRYRKAYNLLRYSLLILPAALLVFGSPFLVNLLDPYSNFGRIFTYIFKPLVVEANNLAALVLNDMNLYFIYKVDLFPLRSLLLLIPGIVLLLVMVLSVTRGRLYCNTVCPVGTLLGLFSPYSLFRIRLDTQNCTRCSLCEKACKAECIDYRNALVDHSRCVACFNCIGVCKDSAVKFDFVPFRKRRTVQEPAPLTESTGVDRDKRRFLAGTVAWLLGMTGISLAQDVPVPKKRSTVPEDREFPVCPPGSGSLEAFNHACTACTLCVSVCPTQVLQPSFLEYGLAGIMQPRMDYHAGFCNYECVKCTEICPTGAILPVVLGEKKLTQLGKAIFIKENCIVETEKTDCGACSEHCPTKAVQMVPYEGSLVIPEVDDTICIGCGACEYACPTIPYKAIFVNGNALHQRAEKPKEQEKAKIELEEEFPF